MNARIALKLHHIGLLRRLPAAVRATPEAIRAAQLARHHELVIDDDTHTPRIAPRVLCDRALDGWLPIGRTVYRAVVR